MAEILRREDGAKVKEKLVLQMLLFSGLYKRTFFFLLLFAIITIITIMYVDNCNILRRRKSFSGVHRRALTYIV